MEYRVAYFCCVCVGSDIVFEIVLYVYICNLVCYSGASLPSCVVATKTRACPCTCASVWVLCFWSMKNSWNILIRTAKQLNIGLWWVVLVLHEIRPIKIKTKISNFRYILVFHFFCSILYLNAMNIIAGPEQNRTLIYMHCLF